MTVIEKINEINDIIKEIFDFTQTNEKVKTDFDEYLATIGARNISLNQMEKIFLPYIFERRIDNKSILEMFREEKGSSPAVESFIKAQASIFEIKKILKNGFELYNLINEKTYKVTIFKDAYDVTEKEKEEILNESNAVEDNTLLQGYLNSMESII